MLLTPILRALSLKLQVNEKSIKKSLALAPLPPLFIYYLASVLFVFIDMGFAFEALGMLLMFLPFVAGVLIVYFIVTYVFIYISQLFLLKYVFLNFWSIIVSSIFLSAVFILVLWWLLSIPLTDLLYINFFSHPIAASYWLLLFKENKKINALS